MFNPTRDQARQFFFDTWGKYKAKQPLSSLEKTTLDTLLLHPEYHPLLDDPDRHIDRDFLPEAGETNPFLHLSMHLAIAEQLSIDQPPGIKAQYQRLLEKFGDPHDAQHRVMECLAEMIWQVQRHHIPFDSKLYLDCLKRHG